MQPDTSKLTKAYEEFLAKFDNAILDEKDLTLTIRLMEDEVLNILASL